MYAIMNVVYGVAWVSGTIPALEVAEEDEDFNVVRLYSGGDGWSYFGLNRDGFDECELTYVDERDWSVTPAMKTAYEKMVNDITDVDVQAAIRALGDPRLVIVPSSS